MVAFAPSNLEAQCDKKILIEANGSFVSFVAQITAYYTITGVPYTFTLDEVTPAQIQAADVVITCFPVFAYTPVAIAALKDHIDNGGILILGSNGDPSHAIVFNPLLSALGLGSSFNVGRTAPGIYPGACPGLSFAVGSDPITTGISNPGTFITGDGNTITLGGNAKALLTSTEGILLAKEGNVYLVGDKSLLSQYNECPSPNDNTRLLDNMPCLEPDPDPEPEIPAIPAFSEWALIIYALLVINISIIYLYRKELVLTD